MRASTIAFGNGFRTITASLLLGLTWVGCNVSGRLSDVKDVGLSPSDIKKDNGVIWQTSNDQMVHMGTCPPATAVINRSCAGLAEKSTPIGIETFKDNLFLAILATRPGPRITPPPKRPVAGVTDVRVKVMEDKVARLKSKIAAGTLTAAETTDFQNQIKVLENDISNLKITFSTAEQDDFDTIIKFLDSAQDVTLDEGERRFALAQASFSGKTTSLLLPPPAGTTNNRINNTDMAIILKYWNETADMFYGKMNGYTSGTPVDINKEPLTSCLSACPAYYSTLVCHFYCWHPSYQQVTPNVRGCFTEIARATFSVKKNNIQLSNYPEIFDYCMYQPFDAVAKSIPAYDQNTIDTNKKNNNKVGVLKYMTAEQADVFKAVMFTWYNPFAFEITDQQSILDQFYNAHTNVSVSHTATTSGKSNHPNFNSILPFMKTWDTAQ